MIGSLREACVAVVGCQLSADLDRTHSVSEGGHRRASSGRQRGQTTTDTETVTTSDNAHQVEFSSSADLNLRHREHEDRQRGSASCSHTGVCAPTRPGDERDHDRRKGPPRGGGRRCFCTLRAGRRAPVGGVLELHAGAEKKNTSSTARTAQHHRQMADDVIPACAAGAEAHTW